METNTQTFTVIIKLELAIDNNNINVVASVPDSNPGEAAPPPAAEVAAATEPFLFDGPDAMTIAEVEGALKACRATIDNMRKENKLTSYYRGRTVRLDRREVEAARIWWSVAKGKV